MDPAVRKFADTIANGRVAVPNLSAATFRMCEDTAKSIFDDLNARNKKFDPKSPTSDVSMLAFKAKLLVGAQKCIKNETGSSEASLQVAIAVIVIFAILCFLYRVHHSNSFNVIQFWEDLKTFGLSHNDIGR